jgi:hypothetical protein
VTAHGLLGCLGSAGLRGTSKDLNYLTVQRLRLCSHVPVCLAAYPAHRRQCLRGLQPCRCLPGYPHRTHAPAPAQTATLMVRPRGWHLPEKHVEVDGKPVPDALFDFGLYFFHNARELLRSGSGPYFYLPKMQSHLEARLWNAVFLDAQQMLGVPRGTIKARAVLPSAEPLQAVCAEHGVGSDSANA